jgi:hypothetical protein
MASAQAGGMTVERIWAGGMLVQPRWLASDGWRQQHALIADVRPAEDRPATMFTLYLHFASRVPLLSFMLKSSPPSQYESVVR